MAELKTHPSFRRLRGGVTVLSFILLNIGLAGAADVHLRVVRNGKNIAAPLSAEFVANIIALLGSCSVHSTAYAVKAGTWQEILRADSFVHLVFSAPTKIRVKGANNKTWEETAIQEILVPLPEGKWPEHVFAKSGTVVQSFTKYDPLALKRVVAEPALALSSVQPYASLMKIMEKK